jgi:hypothetical protein
MGAQPVRIWRRDENGVIVHANIQVGHGRKTLVYAAPLFFNPEEANAFVREHGDPDTIYELMDARVSSL